MILVVGGRGAGKRRYVEELGYSENEIAEAVLDERPVLADLHVFLRGTEDVGEEVLEAILRKKVVMCNEVGCGIVPMDAAERAWRDRVGRTCALLAARAERVMRICCGIPVCLKDSGA